MKNLFALVLLFMLGLSFAVPEMVNVSTYVINAGKFDQQTGGYTVDFYLWMVCADNCSSNFEFTNGRAVSIDKITNEPNEKFYRIQAALQDPVDFREYPFDSHKLTIGIEDKTLTTGQLIYVPDLNASGIESSIQFPGWKVKGWNATSINHAYKQYNEVFSEYEFSILLEREAISALLKIFVPVLFIMLLNFFAHFPDPDKITTRITLHSSFLIAAVMFHVAIGNQLPPLGYLTVADKFMFASYLSLGFSLFSAIVILELTEEKNTALVGKVHHYSGIASFLLWISSLVIVMLTI